MCTGLATERGDALNLAFIRFAGLRGRNSSFWLGIFSLVICFWLGIFFQPLYGYQEYVETQTASQTFGATFTFGLSSPLSDRIFSPDEVAFNASGVVNSFPAPLPLGTAFPPWVESYGTASWSFVRSVNFPSWRSIQLRQVLESRTALNSTGTFYFSHETSSGDLIVSAYDNIGNVLVTPRAGFPLTVAGSISDDLPHAQVVTPDRVYFFWISSGGLFFKTLQGVAVSGLTNMGIADYFTLGVGAGFIKTSNGSFLAVVYKNGNNSIKIITFEETGYPTVFTQSYTTALDPFSRGVSVFQNPRTGKVYFLYTSAPNARVVPATYNGITHTWTFEPEISIPGNYSDSGGSEGWGFSNFECSAMLVEPVGGGVRDNAIRGISSTLTKAFSPPRGIPTVSQFRESSIDFAALIYSEVAGNKNLYTRPLVYPKKYAFDRSGKVLHIEGPPLLNTPVRVMTRFPEIATGTCRVQAVNTGGGTALMDGAQGIIASAGAQFTLAFDKPMMASFTDWVGAGKRIQLLTTGMVPINTSLVSAGASSVVFKTDVDLNPDTSYLVSIASDVLDSNGTQLWAPATFTVKTQKINSESLASEVIGLSAFSDPGYATTVVNGSEINASSTLYFRLRAVDPAFNTVDLATISYFLNQNSVGSLSLRQAVASSTNFFPVPPATQTIVPWLGTHTYRLTYQTASPTASLTYWVTFPWLVGHQPGNLAAGVVVNAPITVTLNENINPASVNTQTVRVTRSGIPASYSVTASGSQIFIDPDDTPEGYLRTQTSYLVAFGSAVTDLAGNPFVSTPATYTFSFTTQNTVTPPTTILSLSLFKDAGFFNAYQPLEEVYGNQTVFVKVTGIDLATQTRDVSTATLNLSWAGATSISLSEIASDSGGIFSGALNLGSLPIFSFPVPIPPVSVGTLSWSSEGVAPKVATQTITFPAWAAGFSKVETLAGPANASDAENVRLNSKISVFFDPPVASASVSSTSLSFTQAGVPVAATYSIRDDGRLATITPAILLTPASLYRVAAPYVASGVRSLADNPIRGGFAFTFKTQPSAVPPISIASVSLFPDNLYNLPDLIENSDYLGTATVFVEMAGVDGSDLTIDTTLASWSNGLVATLTETGVNTGKYRGPLSFTNWPGGTQLTVESVVTPGKKRSLLITYPSVAPDVPASGAINVPIGTIIRVQADEDLRSSSITATSARLIASSGADVACSRSYDALNKVILITPDAPMAFNSSFTVRVSGVVDLVGNPILSPLVFTFSTQGLIVPPLPITGLKLYSNATYSSLLASGATVLPNSLLYCEITGTDLSPGSQDFTQLVLSSVSGASTTVNLVETGLNTGIFRASVTVFNEEDNVLTAFSKTNSSFQQALLLPIWPRYALLNPASGAGNLPLNTTFIVRTNKPYSPLSVTAGTARLFDSTGLLGPTISFTDSQEFRLQAPLATFSEVILQLGPGIRDTLGQEFPLLRASYSTLLPQLLSVTVYSDAGYSNVLADWAKVLPGATLYVQAIGSDPRPGQVDNVVFFVSDGIATSVVNLPEDLPGRFRGGLIVPNNTGTDVFLTPEITPALRRIFSIPPAFVVDGVIPASGAIEVPSDVWPTWTFGSPLDPTTVTAARFSLSIVPGGNVPGTLELSADRLRVTFKPASHLALLSDYELRVGADVRDEDARVLGQVLRTRFTTQSPPDPPSIVTSFKNFSDSGYSAESLQVGPEGVLFLEVRANDVSAVSVDTTRVRLDSSDGIMTALDLTLTETGSDTGVYRLSWPVSLTPGASVRVVSRADASFVLDLQVRTRPTITSISPGSGSLNLALDKRLAITFSRPMSSVSLAGGITGTRSGGVPIGLSGSLQPDGVTWLLGPQTYWATGTMHAMELSSTVTDSFGVALATTTFQFSTRGLGQSFLDLKTGLPPRDQELVSRWGEVVPGPIRLVATSANLLDSVIENRQVTFSWAGVSALATVTELATAPGVFWGVFDPGLARGVAATATLEFANRPQQGFVVAQSPQLIGRHPVGSPATIGELETIQASFSRPIALETASNALKMMVGGINVPVRFVTDAVLTKELVWAPLVRWPSGLSGSAVFEGLTDVLGQPVDVFGFQFTVKGTAGLNVFLDDQFLQPLLSQVFAQNRLFVELVGPLSDVNQANSIRINAVTGRQASITLPLVLQDLASGSRRFWGMLEINAPSRSLPTLDLSMIPGEKLELSSPSLPKVVRVLYFQAAGNTPPAKILSLNLFSEKHFQQKVEESFQTPTLFIEIDAEDLNWLFQDSSKVKVFSDSDNVGLELVLSETGPHTGKFRGFVTFDVKSSFGTANRLKAAPGDRVTVTSLTDSQFSVSTRWLPENRLDNVVAWPNPTRGDRVNFQFRLSFPSEVDLTVYDSQGEELYFATTLGKEGENSFTWVFPRRMANGVYFFNLELVQTFEFPTKKRRVRGKFAVLR